MIKIELNSNPFDIWHFLGGKGGIYFRNLFVAFISQSKQKIKFIQV